MRDKGSSDKPAHATGRFILRYKGARKAPQSDLSEIESLDDLRIIDKSASGRLLLVKAPGGSLKDLLSWLEDWSLTEEKMIPLPDPRPKILSSSKK
jgi:hypothetical protein